MEESELSLTITMDNINIYNKLTMTWSLKSSKNVLIRQTNDQRQSFSRSTQVSWHQISPKYKSPTMSHFHNHYEIVYLLSVSSILWSSAPDAGKSKHFKSLSTTYFQVYSGLPLCQAP